MTGDNGQGMWPDPQGEEAVRLENAIDEKARTRRTLILITVLLLILLIPGLYVMHVIRVQAAKVATTNLLVQLRVAVTAYEGDYRTWPPNLTPTLTGANPRGFQYFEVVPGEGIKDAWDSPIIYIPPTSNTAGSVTSYGADGQPGGEYQDSDITVEIK